MVPEILVRNNIENLNEENKEHIFNTIKKVMYAFNKNVLINYSACKEPLSNENKLVINFWSSYNTDMEFPEKDTAFGYKFCNAGVFLASEGELTFGEDIDLISYNKDNNVINVLYDISDDISEDSHKLFEMLITGLLIKIFESEEKLLKTINDNIEYIQEEQEKTILEDLVNGEKNKQENRKNDLENAKENIKIFREKVRNLYKEIIVLEDLVSANNTSIEKLKKRFREELKIARKNAKVKEIRFDNHFIIIETIPLYSTIKCPDEVMRKYLFGRYNIKLKLSDGTVTFFNKDEKNKRQSCWSKSDQHPHVNYNGNACLGSCASLISECIDSYQWGVLIDVLINFLESVNLDDVAGKHFYNWDEIDENGNVVKVKDKYIPNYVNDLFD